MYLKNDFLILLLKVVVKVLTTIIFGKMFRVGKYSLLNGP